MHFDWTSKMTPVLAMILGTCLFLWPDNVFAVLEVPGDEPSLWVQEGDINLGYLTNVHQPGLQEQCTGPISLFYLYWAETMAMAVIDLNERSDILPNITIGFVMIDACSSARKSLARSMYFIPDVKANIGSCSANSSNAGHEEILQRQRHFDVAGIVGPGLSSQAVRVASLMGEFQVPVISEAATSDELSNKLIYEYFLRLVPPDRFAASTIVDIILKFGWKYIILLYEENSYSDNLGKETEKLLKKTDICIAFSYRLLDSADENDFIWLTNKLIEAKKARIIVSFLGNGRSPKILPRLRDRGVGNHFLLLTGDAYFSAARGSSADMMEGSMMVAAKQKPLPAIADYFEQRTPWSFPPSPWLTELWEVGFGCSWSTNNRSNDYCFQYESTTQMPGYFSPVPYTFLSRIYDTVQVYGDALHRLIVDECPGVFQDPSKARTCVKGRTLLEYLRSTDIKGVNGRVRFDKSGDFLAEYEIFQIQRKLESAGFTNVKVGDWNMLADDRLDIDYDSITFSAFNDTELSSNGSRPTLQSVCSKPCPPRHIVIEDELHCCWKCLPCRANEILAENFTSCRKCDIHTWPDENSSTICEKIGTTYLRPNAPLGLFVASLAALGVILGVVVLVIVHAQRKHKLIRATSRELSSIILVGTILASADVFLMLTEPGSVVCTARRVFFHASVSLIYAPLMVKTVRIYRIFVEAKKGKQKVRFVSSSLQIAIAMMILVIQLLLLLTMESQAPSTVSQKMPIPTEKYSELYCRQDIVGFLVPLSFNVLIIVICALLGYLTRKFPENFNESWHIFLMVATTLFMWVVFIPAYFTTFYAYFQALLLSLCLLLNTFITLCCLFMPRIYAVFFVSVDRMAIVTSHRVGPAPGEPPTAVIATNESGLPG